MITSFIMGAIAGSAAVWFYGREIRRFIDAKTQTVRERAADSLQTVARTADSLARSLDEGLSGAEGRSEPKAA